MYFKITNAEENHNGFQYVDGLNILIDEFNNDPNQSCCKGGFYFTDAINIFKFLDYGVYLREITLPTDDPDFLMIKDKDGDKWRTNMIIFGKRYDLFNVDTFKYLIECSADVHVNDDSALRYCARKGQVDVIKFLIENGANVHACNDYVLRLSAKNGHLDVVKFIVECGANVHAENDFALRWSAENDHLDVVKYLVEHGSDIHADNDYALRWSAEFGHLSVVKFLVESGANIHAYNGPFRFNTKNIFGHSDVVEYLKSKC